MSNRLAGIADELEACSRILDSIQQIATSIELGADHIALARAIDYIASDYQAHLETVIEELKEEPAI